LSTLVWIVAGGVAMGAISHLVPEVNRHRDAWMGVLHFLAFAAGARLLAALRLGNGG